MKYPASIVTDDGWGVIFQGHDVDLEFIKAEMGRECYREPFQIRETHFVYKPRIKNCENYDGWGCDMSGEDWHAHWFEVRPSDDERAKFTVVHEARGGGAA